MEAQEIAALGETLYKESYPSGLTAYALPKAGFQKKYAMFATHYGSIDNVFALPGRPERRVPDGIAHFLEHKLFEEEGGSVMDQFSKLGVSANAFTSYTSTAYLFSATERYNEALALLVRFVQRAYFTAESVEKEQGIIGQELRMYEDDPGWRVFHNLLESLYHHHPVRVDIGGTVDSIREITPELLYECYRTFYHPSNMTVFAVGGVDPAETFAIIGEHLKEAPAQAAIARRRPEEPAGVLRQKTVEKMSVAVPLLEVGFKDAASAYTLRREIAVGILLEALLGHASELYNDLYEKGLLTDRFSAQYFSGDDFGAVIMGGDCPDPEALLEGLLSGLRAAREKGLPREGIERALRKEMGSFLRLFDSPEAIAHAFNEFYFKGQDLFSALTILRELTAQEVEGYLDLFGDDNWSASIVLPQEEDQSS